jgi:phage terminase small subunit
MASKTLSERQKRFVAAYVKEPNATKAYISAGYSEKGAGVSGNKLLKVPHVKAEIDAKLAARARKFEISAENILSELAAIAFFDPATLYDEEGGLIPVHKLPESTRRAISTIENDKGFQRLKMHSKMDGLTLAAKIAGMVKAHETNTAVQIVVRSAPEIEVASTPLQLQPEWD